MFACVARSFSQVVLGLPLGLVPCRRPIIRSSVMPPFLTRWPWKASYVVYFIILGVRSLANASRARQFNPLNPLGWGGYRFLKQIWQPCAVVRAWSCVVVRAWSCVHGRSCVVVRGRAWSCVVGRARSCAVVRGRARSCAVGRAWSCGRAVLPASRPALPWH